MKGKITNKCLERFVKHFHHKIFPEKESDPLKDLTNNDIL